MIQRLKLTNFRKHKKAEIEFSPGLNVIFGNNNAGKTTFLRAIRYLGFQFTQSREGVIHTGEKQASVVAEFYGLPPISREISAKKNQITIGDLVLNNPTTDVISGVISTELEKYGLASLAINNLDSAYLQFQSSGQLFLVDATPKQVKDVLSALSYVSVLDDARSKASGMRTFWNSEIKVLDSSIAAATSEEEKFRPLSLRAGQIREDLVSSNERLDQVTAKVSSLEALLSRYRGTELGYMSDEVFNRSVSLCSTIKEEKNRGSALSDRYRKLRSLFSEYTRLGSSVVKESSLAEAENCIEKLRLLRSDYSVLGERYAKLTSTYLSFVDVSRRLEDARREISTRESGQKEALARATEGGICPIYKQRCPIAEGTNVTR